MTVLSCMTLMIGTTQATASIKQRQYANAGCKSADASWLAAAYYTLAENILAIEVYHSSLNACDGTTECKTRTVAQVLPTRLSSSRSAAHTYHCYAK
jgi:hypothetical protein